MLAGGSALETREPTRREKGSRQRRGYGRSRCHEAEVPRRLVPAPHNAILTFMVNRARVIWALASVGVIAAAAALYWFQPWRLFTNSTVNEALPSAVAVPTPSVSDVVSSAPPQNMLLATGT